MAGPDYNNPQAGIPTDKVLDMKKQGLTNNQIIQYLQREGFTQSQVFDAMNQAEIKAGVTSIPSGAMQSVPPANPMNMGQQPQGDMPPSFPDQALGNIGGADVGSLNNISTEELIEALIDEKWNDLLKDINKIIDWKDKSEGRLSRMEQTLEDMKRSFDSLHKAVVGKVGEYDKHILDVGAEIQAMEKVFQKVLPTFTENINELTRITDKLKKK